jgi:hypothetical protein
MNWGEKIENEKRQRKGGRVKREKFKGRTE